MSAETYVIERATDAERRQIIAAAKAKLSDFGSWQTPWKINRFQRITDDIAQVRRLGPTSRSVYVGKVGISLASFAARSYREPSGTAPAAAASSRDPVRGQRARASDHRGGERQSVVTPLQPGAAVQHGNLGTCTSIHHSKGHTSECIIGARATFRGGFHSASRRRGTDICGTLTVLLACRAQRVDVRTDRLL
jgi:hypothetical protein